MEYFGCLSEGAKTENILMREENMEPLDSHFDLSFSVQNVAEDKISKQLAEVTTTSEPELQRHVFWWQQNPAAGKQNLFESINRAVSKSNDTSDCESVQTGPLIGINKLADENQVRDSIKW